MADNVTLSAGTADGAVVATDQITTVHYPLVKLAHGALDSATLVSTASGLPVQQQGVFTVTDVSGTVSLPTGAATAAKQPALGTAGVSSTDVLSVQGIASGTALPVSGTVTANAGTNLNTSTLALEAGGNLAAAAASLAILDDAHTADFDTGAGTDTTPAFGIALPASGGAVVGGTSTNPIRTDPTGTTTQPVSGTVEIGATSLAALENTTVTVGAALPAGANNIGDVDVLTLPSLPTGANAIGTVEIGATSLAALESLTTVSTVTTVGAVTAITNALPAGTNNIGDVDVLSSALPTGASTLVEQQTQTTALQLLDNAVVDHDAAAVAGVRPIGLEARTSDGTAVASGDAVRALATILGKQIVKLDAVPDLTWSYAAASGGIVNTTAVTIKAAGAAGVRNYLKSLNVVNGHATVSTEVLVRDGAAGTVLHRGWAQAAGGGYAVLFDPPLRGTAATLLEVVNVTTGSATYVNASGFVGAE